jgi:hypothetical protein
LPKADRLPSKAAQCYRQGNGAKLQKELQILLGLRSIIGFIISVTPLRLCSKILVSSNASVSLQPFLRRPDREIQGVM